MSFIWMISFIVLVLIEIFTINLVTIWFAIGALVSFFVSLWTENIGLEILIFIVVSLITLLITKKAVNKIKDKEMIPTNLDRAIGQTGIVTEKIKPLEPGEVKVDGKKWTAIADKEIDINDEVKILSINGVKLKVEKIREEN